ncbi:hypothetical protein Aperf_G00000051329 [Anoplocephala perfoliata]
MYFRPFRLLRGCFRRSAFLSRPITLGYCKYQPTLTHLPLSTGLLCLLWPFSGIKEPTLNEKTSALLRTATLQIQEGKYKEADENLHHILKLLADAVRESHITPTEHAGSRARVFRELTQLYLRQQNYRDAEKLLSETIRSSIEGGMDPYDPCIIELSLKLALLSLKLGENDKASAGFDFCFDAQTKKTTQIFQSANTGLSDEQINEIALLGLVSNAYAHFLIQKGDLTAALEKLEISLKSAQTIYPTNHENCLHLQADLANIESRVGHSTKALERLRSAIREAKTQKEPTLSLVRLFCTGAVIEGGRGEFFSASEWLDKAVESANKLPSKKDQEMSQKEIKPIRSMLESWREDEKKEDNERVK